jgi:hypothetical protein
MAEQNTQSDVFKFVALRPPMPPSKDAAGNNFTYDDRAALETPVGRLVSQFNVDNASKIQDTILAFIAASKFDLGFPQSIGDKSLDIMLAAAKDLASEKISTAALIAEIEKATGQKIKSLYESAPATKMRHDIWDRYYAFYILSSFNGQDLTSLTNNLRVLHLVNLLSRGQSVPDAATLSDILSATPVVDKIFTTLPKPKVDVQPPAPDALPPAKASQYKGLWHDLINTSQALADVRNLTFSSTTQTTTETVPINQPAKVKAKASTAKSAAQTKMASALQTNVAVLMAIDPASFGALPTQTKTLLGQLKITEKNSGRTAHSRPALHTAGIL